MNLETTQKLGEDLFHKLHLSTYPVAVKYIQSKSEIPEGAYQPSSHNKKMSLCQAFTQTRRWGTTVVMTADDNFCTPSTVMHRWVNLSMGDLMDSQVKQRWHSDAGIEEQRIINLRNLLGDDYIDHPGRYIGSICSPIHKVRFLPDSVLIYCDGVQITHIIHALSYENKYNPSSAFDGFTESCFKGALLPFITQRPQVVIPGAGDRTFAGIFESELGIGLPIFLLSYVLENLFKTGKRLNLGFPMKSAIPMDLDERITPGFKFLRKKMDRLDNDSE